MNKILLSSILVAAAAFAAKPAPVKASEASAAPSAASAPAQSFDAQISYALGLRLGDALAAQAKDTALKLDVIMAGARDGLSKGSSWAENYGIGLQQGMQLGALGKEGVIKVDTAVFFKAIRDGMANDKSKQAYPDSVLQQSMSELQGKMMAAQQKKIQEMADKNLRQGIEFLALNKSKPGIVTTASGLQYKTLTEGKGESPSENDTVVVHYTGKTLDGETFDSSVDRGEPATFPVGGLIPGWVELLKLMKAGQKVEVWIPDNLAYGDRGAPPRIGPKSTLTFTMELISIKKAAAAAAAKPTGAPVKKDKK